MKTIGQSNNVQQQTPIQQLQTQRDTVKTMRTSANVVKHIKR